MGFSQGSRRRQEHTSCVAVTEEGLVKGPTTKRRVRLKEPRAVMRSPGYKQPRRLYHTRGRAREGEAGAGATEEELSGRTEADHCQPLGQEDVLGICNQRRRGPQESITTSCPSLHHICCVSHLPAQQETKSKGTEGLPCPARCPRRRASWTGRLPSSLAVHRGPALGHGTGRRRMGLGSHPHGTSFTRAQLYGLRLSRDVGHLRASNSQPLYPWRFCPRETNKKIKINKCNSPTSQSHQNLGLFTATHNDNQTRVVADLSSRLVLPGADCGKVGSQRAIFRF